MRLGLKTRQLAALLVWGFAAGITPLHADLIGISLKGAVENINPATGTGTVIGNSGATAPDSLAANSAGTLYTVDAVGGGVFNLDTIDPITGAATVVTSLTGLGSSYTVGGLSFSSNGTLFASVLAAGMSSSSLYTIDPTSGSATLIGLTANGCCVTDIAFGPNGTLYGWDYTQGGGLMTINTSTGAGTFVNPTSGLALGMTGLTFDSQGTLWGAETDTGFGASNLYTIDTATGNATLVGNIGPTSTMGIAFTSVPEPGTIISGLCGLFLLAGLGASRRIRLSR